MHRKFTKKLVGGLLVKDKSIFKDIYPNIWAILLDKGYQRVQVCLCTILPKKKPRIAPLSYTDKLETKEHALNWILVINFFRCLFSLWGVIPKKYHWNMERYNILSKVLMDLPAITSSNIFFVMKTTNSIFNFSID